jgi:hypothetical protein
MIHTPLTYEALRLLHDERVARSLRRHRETQALREAHDDLPARPALVEVEIDNVIELPRPDATSERMGA